MKHNDEKLKTLCEKYPKLNEIVSLAHGSEEHTPTHKLCDFLIYMFDEIIEKNTEVKSKIVAK